jgi:hypothetical protein
MALFSEEISPVHFHKAYVFLLTSQELSFVDENRTKYQRIPRLFNFKATEGRNVSSAVQFHHVKQIRDGLSVTAVRWRAGGRKCVRKKGSLHNVDTLKCSTATT